MHVHTYSANTEPQLYTQTVSALLECCRNVAACIGISASVFAPVDKFKYSVSQIYANIGAAEYG